MRVVKELNNIQFLNHKKNKYSLGFTSGPILKRQDILNYKLAMYSLLVLFKIKLTIIFFSIFINIGYVVCAI